MPLTIKEHVPQIPSRQSWSNAIGSTFFRVSSSLTISSISRKETSGLIFLASYSLSPPLSLGPFWRQTLSFRFIETPPRNDTLSITPLNQLHIFKCKRFFMQCRGLAHTLVFPSGHVAEFFIVPERLAVRRLVFFAEMAAAGFFPVKRILAK